MQTPYVSKDIYEVLIRQAAKSISEIRRLASLSEEIKRLIRNLEKIPSSAQAMDSDWRNACTFIGSKILYEEEINFIELDPECYPQLEQTWLHEIKKLRAYYIWEQENNSSEVVNYLRVCDIINGFLLKRATMPVTSFSDVREYIERKYLTNGVLDETKAQVIIEIKARAQRAWEFSKRANENDNWFKAKDYLMSFYENIIPAVVEKSTVHIEKVCKSFRNENGTDPYGIVSCFEVIVAAAFLDKNEVLQIYNIKSPLL